MNILVTGGNGYIGGYLLRMLCQDEKFEKIYAVTRIGSLNEHLPTSKRITPVEYDGTAESLKPAVGECNTIIHLGALYATKKDDGTVKNLLRSNIEFTVDLLQAAAEANPQAVMVSTSTFSSFDDEYRYAPKSFYAATKSAVEVLAAAFPLKVAFLRLPDTYGPGDWRTKVHNLLRNAVKNELDSFAFQKPEHQKINLAHVEDVCKALLHTARELRDNLTVGVHSFDLFYPENVITLGEVAEALIHEHKTSVAFPLFGEVDALPPQRYVLPRFALEHNPHYDLASTLYSEEK